MSFLAGFPVPLKVGPITLRMGTSTSNTFLLQAAHFFYPPAQVTIHIADQGISYRIADAHGEVEDQSVSGYEQLARARTRALYGLPVLFIWPAAAALFGVPPAITISTTLLALYLYVRTHIARHVLVFYDMRHRRQAALEGIDTALAAISVSAAFWRIQGATKIAGMNKTEITIAHTPKEIILPGRGLPRRFRSNISFPQIRLADCTLFFAPDALYVETKKTLQLFPYDRVSIQVSTIHFREEGATPKQARIAGKTWLRVTKAGVADQRFSINPEFPVVIYGKMQVIVQGALNEVLLNVSPSQFQALSMAIQNMLDTASPEGKPDNGHATSYNTRLEQAKRKAEAAAQFVKVGFAVAADWPFHNTDATTAVVRETPPAPSPHGRKSGIDVDISQPAAIPVRMVAWPFPTKSGTKETNRTQPPQADTPDVWPFPNSKDFPSHQREQPRLQSTHGRDDDIDLSQFVLNALRTRDPDAAQTSPALRPPFPHTQVLTDATEPAWVAPGASSQVAGFSLPGGMIYLGTEMRNAYQEADPCIIDPAAPVLSAGDDAESGDLGYWPNYSKISPERRHGYLKWLNAGRRDLHVNIGYVFMFFYGLERRAISEREAMLASPGEREAIIEEVEQLVHIYRSGASFESYAESFLLYLRSLDPTWRAYNDEPGSHQGHGVVPASIALALGQLAADSLPLPASWALRWARGASNISKRTPAIRCAAQFDVLFAERYQQQYPKGYMLGINKTPLRISHYLASSAYRGQAVSLVAENIPDVTMLVRHIGKLQKLVDACTADLDAYSRALARAANNPLALATTMLLPQLLWPEHIQAALAEIKTSIATDFQLIPVENILARLALKSPYNKDDLAAASTALASVGIAAEPPIPVAHKDSGGGAKVCLFEAPLGQANTPRPPAYEAAKVTLALASVIATADGTTTPPNTDHLLAQVASWPGLTPAHQQHLRAYLHVVLDQPPPCRSRRNVSKPALPSSAGKSSTCCAA